MWVVNFLKYLWMLLGDVIGGVCLMLDRVVSQFSQWILVVGGLGGGYFCFVEF